MSKNMSKKRRRSRREEEQSQGPNWNLIGGIVGVVVIGLFGFIIFANINSPQTTAEPTPVLGEQVVNVARYCEDFPERCVVTGNLESDTTLVEIPDYGCPHCAAFNADTAPLLQEAFIEDITWMVMPFALGPNTRPTGAAVLCAAEQSQEMGMHFHETVFGLQGSAVAHTADGFTAVAEQIEGLDVAEFDACVADGRNLANVSLNQQAARGVGVQSTPTFFLNGTMIRGNEGFEVFQSRIAAALGS